MPRPAVEVDRDSSCEEPGSRIRDERSFADGAREIKEGKEMRGGYEIVIETVDGSEVEVTVTADGKILEDSGEENEVGRAK